MSGPHICFIGNSHVGPMAVATREAASLPFTTTFLYAPGMALMDLQVVDGQLVPTSDTLRHLLGRSGGTGTATLAEFDAFVIIGLTLSIKTCANIYWSFRLMGHEDAGSDHPKRLPRGGHFLISEDAMREALAGQLANTIAGRLARSIRAASGKPVILIPQPLAVFEEEFRINPGRAPNALQHWAPFRDAEVAERTYRLFVEGLGIMAKRHDLRVMPQPAHTIERGYSRAIYKGRNAHHLNDVYGHELLEAFNADVLPTLN